MNRKIARKIAESITNEALKEMFENAKKSIKDWSKVSNVNKGMTKGTSWNILGKDFDVTVNYHILAKTNMVREFGEFLPAKYVPEKKLKPPIKPPVHQDPQF